MKITWLTRSGLLFDTGRVKILVDPCLSDLSAKALPECRMAEEVQRGVLAVKPDMLLITHNHSDHLDQKTLSAFLCGEGGVTVLSSESAYNKLCEFGAKNNYVLLAPHSVWSEKGITIYSVKAEHDDRAAVGFIIDDGSKTYYVSGDTLYNYDVIDDVLSLVEDGVDYAFLPICGRGCNMNARDAADFAYEIGAKCAVPVHYGPFDNVSPQDFDFADALILEPFKEKELK